MTKLNSKPFRLRAKKLFLTYPQLPELENLEQLALEQLIKTFNVTQDDLKYYIAKELHEDGNPHLHVYLEFKAVQSVYSETRLDLSFGDKSYHGNYQSVRSTNATLEYISKNGSGGDQHLSNMDLPIFRGKYYSNIHEHLHDVLKDEGMSSALDVLFKTYPTQAIQKGSVLIKNLELADNYDKMQKSLDEVPKYTIEQFGNLPAPINEWIEMVNPPAILVYGPSGVGKTELVKAVLHKRGKKPLFVREKQTLKDFRPDIHTAIIFDDFDPVSVTREELIHLYDTGNDSAIRILYKNVRIPASAERVFTANYSSGFLRNEQALIRRLHVIQIKSLSFPGFEKNQVPLRYPELGYDSDFNNPEFQQVFPYLCPTPSTPVDNSSSLDDNSSNNKLNLLFDFMITKTARPLLLASGLSEAPVKRKEVGR